MIAQTSPTAADIPEEKKRTGQAWNHKRHRSIPGSDPATNCATVAPPETTNT